MDGTLWWHTYTFYCVPSLIVVRRRAEIACRDAA